MAERAYGSPCPGCTVEIISARIARFPQAYPACRPCVEHGALYHAQLPRPQEQQQETARDQEDAQECARRASGGSNGESHAKS